MTLNVMNTMYLVMFDPVVACDVLQSHVSDRLDSYTRAHAYYVQ